MSARSPLVSVVVPAFNAQCTVAEAVCSALRQEDAEVEVIVVDDGSTDATATTVESISDPRVRLIRQANAGTSAARNAGIQHARGEWIAFLDADDVWLPHKLRTQLQAVGSRPGSVAVQSGAYFADQDLGSTQARRCVDQPTGNLLSFLRFQNLPAFSTWIVRRDAVQAIGQFDPTLPSLEDWDYCIRIAHHDEPVSVPEPLILYRQHAGNRSLDIDALAQAGQMILRRVFADSELPADVRGREREVYARLYLMLCGGTLRTHRWAECAYWGARALAADPSTVAYMLALPVRRLRRRRGDVAGRPDRHVLLGNR